MPAGTRASQVKASRAEFTARASRPRERAPTPHTGYDAARTAAAVGARGSRGWVRVWDVDAVSLLHGVLTNDITSITAAHMLFEIASVFAANKTRR